MFVEEDIMFEISELENGREGVRVTGEVDIYTATQFKEPIEKLIGHLQEPPHAAYLPGHAA